MKKLMYTGSDGVASLVYPASKAQVEKELKSKHQRDFELLENEKRERMELELERWRSQNEIKEDARRDALAAEAERWLADNPGSSSNDLPSHLIFVRESEPPSELVYHKTEVPEFVFTDADYENHVISRSIPAGISFKKVNDEDIPSTREFRSAWVDHDETTKVNLDMRRVRDEALTDLRRRRKDKLEESDRLVLMLQESEESGDTRKLERIKRKRRQLRNATESLKSMAVDGVFDDERILRRIKRQRDQDLDIDINND